MEKKFGSELIVISRVKRDGSGVEPVDDNMLAHIKNEKFDMNTLSLTQKTYIACGFYSFVVKLKDNESQT